MNKTTIKLPNLGSLWMLVAALGFAVMGAMVKLGAGKFSSSELVFYRSLISLVIIVAFITKQGETVKTDFLGLHLARSIIGFLALLLFFYAISKLPLATAITLSNTSTLFLGIFTPLFLKEKPKAITFITLMIGFLGITLLLQPSVSGHWVDSMIGLCAGFGAAIAYLLVKQLAKRHEPDGRTVFYFTLISTIGAGLWMLLGELHSIAWDDLPVLLGLGTSATIAQLAMTRAYRTGSTLVVACLSYTTPILASLLGFIFWQETLNMQAWIAIGIIIASSVVNTITANKS